MKSSKESGLRKLGRDVNMFGIVIFSFVIDVGGGGPFILPLEESISIDYVSIYLSTGLHRLGFLGSNSLSHLLPS